MRQLVSIREVTGIQAIENADAIELALFDGWQCITKKGEFAVGDNAVYFEIDSAVPMADERFGFLKGRANRLIDGVEYAVIKTMKMRGELSQGLALPLSSFPELENQQPKEDDETGLGYLIGVIKYEKPLAQGLSGFAKGNFPDFIPKTDEERVQNLKPRDFQEMIRADKHNENNPVFRATVKLDGSSLTLYVKDGKFGVCSRNLELDMDNENNDNNAFVHMAKNHIIPRLESYAAETVAILKQQDMSSSILRELLARIEDFGVMGAYDSFALQGELISPKIQGNYEKVNEPEFHVFKMFRIQAKEYVTLNFMKVVTEEMGLKSVPVVELFDKDGNTVESFAEILGENWVRYRDIALGLESPRGEAEAIEQTEWVKEQTARLRQFFLDNADGKSLNHDHREGIVVYFGTGQSFKAISNRYLLKEK